MSEASEPAKQIGILFADPIRASSRHPAASTGRTEDCTRPTRQNIKSALAMWEPSTEDIRLNVLLKTISLFTHSCSPSLDMPNPLLGVADKPEIGRVV
jgi:hypothetical protein